MYYKGINSYVKSFRIMVLADKNRKISTGNQAIKLKLACLIYKDSLLPFSTWPHVFLLLLFFI